MIEKFEFDPYCCEQNLKQSDEKITDTHQIIIDDSDPYCCEQYIQYQQKGV